MTKRWLLWVPLLLFAAFVAISVAGMRLADEGAPRSFMIGKALPVLSLPAASGSRPALMLGGNGRHDGPRLLNIFASWCVPCAAEAPQLAILARAGVPIDGIAVRDARADVDAFLGRWGNPYARIGLDARSQAQLALGSSGVPETFLIDGRGRIISQHIGVITADDVPRLIEQWRAAR